MKEGKEEQNIQEGENVEGKQWRLQMIYGHFKSQANGGDKSIAENASLWFQRDWGYMYRSESHQNRGSDRSQ